MALIDLVPGDEPIHSLPGTGTDRPSTFFASLQERYGVALPPGWLLRWLDPSSVGEAGYLPGQLVNIATGERLDIAPFEPLGSP